MHNRVRVGRIYLSEHPTDPRYQIGVVSYPVGETTVSRVVVVGRHYEEGQLGLFIPEGSVVPEGLLREMWLWNDQQGKGRLSGKRGDRVKAKEMSGVASHGLFYGAKWYDESGAWHRSELWDDAWAEGDDVGDRIGVLAPTMNISASLLGPREGGL